VRFSRRQAIQGAGAVGLGLLAGCGRLPGSGRSSTSPRIGFLVTTTPEATAGYIGAFKDALRDFGYTEGQNIVVEYRFANGAEERVPDLAAELVSLPVNVLVTAGPATAAARQFTDTIPIIQAAGGDLVGAGLAASLARPGGNVTGVTSLSPQLSGKRLQLLTEIVPEARRVAVLWDPRAVPARQGFHETQRAAQQLGIQLWSLEVNATTELDAAFHRIALERPDALFTLTSGITLGEAPRIIEFAAHHYLPAMYDNTRFIAVGGFMLYGANVPSLYRRAAAYVDKVLKGTRPADLPIEQPREFDFVINIKTAQALGLTIPHHVLLQATEVIQ
jgi:putative tryptophan/tyrosine transport system substrate-binding protein